MSDDRMDRAERIRNMREGNRGTDDDQTSADDTASPGTETDESPVTATETDAGGSSTTPEPSAEESATTPEPSAGETTTEMDGDASEFEPLTTDEESADAGSGGGLEADATTEAGSGSTDAASEAQAAAQRAAASAAEVMGTESDAGATPAAGDQSAAGADTPGESGTPAAAGVGAVPGDVNGVELPDRELLEEAMATSSVESTEGGARAAMEGGTTQSEEVVRVLEFSLGEEYYCLDIEYVEEIVKRETVTRVPNTPSFVDGVVDLRGQITTILEPKEMMTIDGEGEQNLIIVFDPEQFEDQGAIGWVVDEVRQVVPVTESEINTPPVDAEYINGVVDREEYDQFVIWIEPEDVLTQATATDEE